jgi:murein DD-endopeptidase MepM/ murein hydrolase activator NlpD
MRAAALPMPFGKVRRAAPAPKLHGIRPLYLYGLFGLLLATNAVTLVGLLMSPDIAGLVGGQNDAVVAAYQDRLVELRVEVDRLHSRHYAQTGDINLQLQELTQQQELLSEQHQYVKQLADKAVELGLQPAPDSDDDDDTAPLVTGSIAPASATLADPKDPSSEIASVNASMQQMLTDSRLALAALNESAKDKTTEIVGALATIGIKPRLPDDDDATGGPLLPPVNDAGDSVSLVDDANDVMDALNAFKAARDAYDLAPIHKPTTTTRISSTFGNRKDPFTGRMAFHSGMDFPAPSGTTVTSAGFGKVIFVGQINGYGNAVEVDHGNGLITLYGHLSAFLVKQGQVVNTGTPIARVGSTGRSTGPHLHFEVRRSDTPVDPSRYLAVGKQLQKVLAG